MRTRRAFTLVELLVVVGIISVLAAILLPALARAREQGRRVQCAANLRQLAAAALAYADQNRGLLPGIGTFPQQPHDWVYWFFASPPYDDPDGAALAAYLGRPLDVRILRCPSDDVEGRNRYGTASLPPYAFSYTMNRFMGDRWGACVRVTQIGRSSQKLLFVEEDVRTMEDGAWLEAVEVGLPRTFWEPLSARHELARDGDTIPVELLDPSTGPTTGTGWRGAFLFRRGNAAYVDGHVEFTEREYTLQPRNIYP